MINIISLFFNKILHNMKTYNLILLLFFLNLKLCFAVSVAPIFSSHMVLQQHKEIAIWGTASSNEIINITLGNEQKTVKAPKDGNWIVRFAPRKASKEAIDLKVNDYHFKDILIGEVWLCSGQSNMAFNLRKIDGSKALIDSANIASLRFIKYDLNVPNVSPNGYSPQQLNNANAKRLLKPSSWQQSNKSNVGASYAVAWLLGKKLTQILDIPVGIIMFANGGSAMNNWIAYKTLQSDTLTSHFFTQNWLTNENVYINHRRRCQSAFKSVLKENTVYIPGEFPYRWVCEPSILFEAGIAPLKGLAIRGVFWYQGESDAENIKMSKVLFPMLISNWREHFKQADLPFVFVQLPIYDNEHWSLFREIQRQTEMNIKQVYMVSTIDIGDNKDLHPTDKQPIGDRAARLALKHVYGHKLVEFPKLKSWKIKKNKLYLYFSEIGEGFVECKNKLYGFEIEVREGEFRPIYANLSKNRKVIVIDHFPENTKSIRYAWSGVPTPSVKLFNSEKLPLGPFLLNLEQ